MCDENSEMCDVNSKMCDVNSEMCEGRTGTSWRSKRCSSAASCTRRRCNAQSGYGNSKMCDGKVCDGNSKMCDGGRGAPGLLGEVSGDPAIDVLARKFSTRFCYITSEKHVV